MNELADATLLLQTDSWYMGANIPGKPCPVAVAGSQSMKWCRFPL